MEQSEKRGAWAVKGQREASIKTYNWYSGVDDKELKIILDVLMVAFK